MRKLKKQLLILLQSDDFSQRHDELCTLPGRKVVNPLFSFFLHREAIVRWRAITAMGIVVTCLANESMESARVVMRRLMWSLNDESGGIGWGAPEAMGESIARHDRLSEEYVSVLISYIWEDGNYLEYEPLQRGALWAVGRVAQARPPIMMRAVPLLVPFLRSSDATVRGMAARALGFLDPMFAREDLEKLLDDTTEITVYHHDKLHTYAIKSLAGNALSGNRDLIS